MDGTSAGVVTADMMKEELKRRRRLEKEKSENGMYPKI